jgi:hypothetical protein
MRSLGVVASHMEAVEADLGLRQYLGHTLRIGCAHVHANVFDVIRAAAVRDRIGLEFDDRPALDSDTRRSDGCRKVRFLHAGAADEYGIFSLCQ